MKSLLCVDIGNTSTGYGLYRGGRFIKLGWSASEGVPKIVSEYIKYVSKVPNNHIIISSVVPEITRKIKKLGFKRKASKRIWIIGDNLRVKIYHNYNNINRLGSDRLVNIYGACTLFRPPILILDYGTALTCDYVSDKGVFLGGLIIPGPETAFKSLCQRAALLPQLPFPKGVRSNTLLGRSTKSGMTAGILQGYGAMTDELIRRFRRKFGRRFKVVATGGLAKDIDTYSENIDIVDPKLTLKSLVEIYKAKASLSA